MFKPVPMPIWVKTSCCYPCTPLLLTDLMTEKEPSPMTEPKKPGYQPRQHRKAAEQYEAQALARIAPASEKGRKAEDARLRKVFAERMFKARHELNGWTQLHAAKMLGFSNSSPLAKIEMGESFARTLPGIAARVYRVSTDYLLGISDFDYECRPPGTEWESAIVNANAAFFQMAMNDHAKALARIARSTGVSVDGLAKVIVVASKAKEVFGRIQEINPEAWGDVKGGTRLEAVILELDRVCQDVRRTAARARVDLQNQGYAAGITEPVDKTLETCQ
jgi:transcriptional regulator with XRE-family HTH domain